MVSEKRVRINSEIDIVVARQEARALAAEAGITGSDLTLIATAVSEVARNIVTYAKQGEIILTPIQNAGHRGIMVVAQDHGSGIPDVARALEDGYSTAHGLGLGLPGARRLMDEFNIVSEVGKGTTVTMKKWAR